MSNEPLDTDVCTKCSHDRTFHRSHSDTCVWSKPPLHCTCYRATFVRVEDYNKENA